MKSVCPKLALLIAWDNSVTSISLFLAFNYHPRKGINAILSHLSTPTFNFPVNPTLVGSYCGSSTKQFAKLQTKIKLVQMMFTLRLINQKEYLHNLSWKHGNVYNCLEKLFRPEGCPGCWVSTENFTQRCMPHLNICAYVFIVPWRQPKHNPNSRSNLQMTLEDVASDVACKGKGAMRDKNLFPEVIVIEASL